MQSAFTAEPNETMPAVFGSESTMDGIAATPAVRALVASQVHALLTSSAAYHSLPDDDKRDLENSMNKIAAYSASLAHEEFVQSRRLGETPILRQEEIIHLDPQPAAAMAMDSTSGSRAFADGPRSDEFSPRAASQLARITKETLKAISFPQFVADLIKGTYAAIVDSSIKQMEAYVSLLKNVAATVDQFMGDNISDNQARDYLAGSHPETFQVAVSNDKPKLTIRDGAEDQPPPDFSTSIGFRGKIELSDENAEDVLVPAARRFMARERQKVLATLVMMGIQRIVVTTGRIKASMKFHIDTKDTATSTSARASEFDFKNETTAGVGGGVSSFFGGGHIETKNTISYVSTESENRAATDEINTSADLTSEVEIKFKSDYLPMERFATPEMMAAIQGNTMNPQANAANQPGQPGARPGQPAAPVAAPAPRP